MSARIGAMITASAAASGADPGAVAEAGDFDAATAEDPDARMSLAAETALWAAAEALTGDPEIGLRTALRIQPGIFDVLDYAVRTAPTLRAALERLARYNRLVHDAAEFVITDEGAHVRVVHRFRGGLPGQVSGQHRHSIEFTIGSLVVIGHQISQAVLAPLAVAFRHAAPPSLELHRQVFGLAPTFSATDNHIVFAAVDLARPAPAADPRLWRVIERHAEALLAARPVAPQTMTARVGHEVLATLSEGTPSLAAIAERLKLSERSLQRRLRDEGASFEALVEGLRKDLALSYLKDRRMGIAEVAYLLGYSEPSAFHRAFKRWTGATPGELRA